MSMPASVLSVEDDDGMSLLLKMAFEESCPDIELHRVSTAQKALELLNPSGNFRRPSLILIDINLPAIDGFEFLKRVKDAEYTRDIPVVVFTASVRQSDQHRCVDLGADRYCRKGDSFEEILDAVKEFCKLAESKAA